MEELGRRQASEREIEAWVTLLRRQVTIPKLTSIYPWQPTDMRFKTCQFIEGKPTFSDNCKCGQPTDGGPWCEVHWAMIPANGRPERRAAE